MEGCGLASGLSTLCSAEASLPSSGVGVARTLSSIAEGALSTWVLGGGGGLRRARKLGHALHIITGRFNNPQSTSSSNNAEHIVHKTGTYWDEGHIGKRTSVLHHQLRDVQALKTRGRNSPLDNLRVQKRYACRKTTSSMGLCTCHMQKGVLPQCTYRLSEWHFA